jgi:hypothetical protein
LLDGYIPVVEKIILKMLENNIFFIFKKLFLISSHQNDLKILKKLISNKYFLKSRNTI